MTEEGLETTETFTLDLIDEALARLPEVTYLKEGDDIEIMIAPLQYFDIASRMPRRWMVSLSRIWKGFERIEKRRMVRLNTRYWNYAMHEITEKEYNVDLHYEKCLRDYDDWARMRIEENDSDE